MSAKSYISRGVSPTKDDVKKAVSDQDKGVFPGAFCKINEDIAGDEKFCTAIHADGAGTKSSVAYIMYKETNDTSWFRGIAHDSLVMNTDDLGAIGATDNFYLSNTIGRNAHRINGECISQIIAGYDESIKDLKKLGINIFMTGGETADVGDLVRTVIADSTIVVRLKKENVINAANIKPGDVIVGLASFGRATYEKKENSGIGSNGLTGARHLLLSKEYLNKYPESVSKTIEPAKIYCGKHKLEDPLIGSSLTVGEAILSPTRTYLPVLKEVFDKIDRKNIHGIIHCTGGGAVKCKDFGESLVYIKDNFFPRPAIFDAIYDSGDVEESEMYQIFNMGHRMELYCKEEYAKDIFKAAKKYNVEAKIIGRVEANNSAGNKVIIIDRNKEFVY